MISVKKEQLDFLDWEFGVFFHFGIRTFNEGHRDWDISAVKQAGAKYAVLVCKHHDGFANWPSAYTDYSVKNTPWKNGAGDVVREFVDACRRYEIRIGLYYSPAQFGSAQMNGKEYDDYFISQIRELLTGYGKIDYLWFDGCGSEGHRYDTSRIIREIRSCQPEILIFNMWDPDTRWVGNEAGVADSPNPLVVDFDGRPRFLPTECDCRMRAENWFYSDADEATVKSPDELMGLYYYSVGRGANLLVNIGPDRRGRLPEADKRALLAFGEQVRDRFSEPIPCRAAAGEKKLTLECEAQPVDHVILSEEITADEITSFTVRAYPAPYGAPVSVHAGTTIGHKAICRFPALRTGRVEIEFDKNKAVSAQLYYVAGRDKK